MLTNLIKSAQSQAKHYLNPFNNAKLLTKIFNLYPPYLGAGIRVETMDFANQHVRVSMPLTKLNQNIVGTQFGGSLYSMTDPFVMTLLMQKLGNDYVVWDKSACIDFIKAGKNQVHFAFTLTDDEVATIKDLAQDGKAVFRDYKLDIKDEQGEVVAIVKKKVYIRLRDFSKSKHQSSRI